MSLREKAKTSKLGLKGKTPPKFDDANSTIHYSSSSQGTPSFSTYKNPKLRTLKPTKLGVPKTVKKYLDNPPT